MAVQQGKKSKSRTRMRRSRYKLSMPTLTEERGKEGAKKLGDLRRRHHIGKDGIYRGVQYYKIKEKVVKDEDDQGSDPTQYRP